MNKDTIIVLALMLFLGCTKKETTPNTNNVTNTTANNAKWLKSKTFIQYAADGVTETYKSETFYDSEGRINWVNDYTNGVKTSQNRDYSYNGDECTYYADYMPGGVLSQSVKTKIVYKND